MILFPSQKLHEINKNKEGNTVIDRKLEDFMGIFLKVH